MVTGITKATPRAAFASGKKARRSWELWIGPGFVGGLIILGFYFLRGDIQDLRTEIRAIQETLKEHGERLARIEGRLDPYEPPAPEEGG